MNWQIREASIEDAGRLGLVGAATFLESFAAEAISRGAGRLIIAVYGGNARAIAFYAKNGLALLGERRGHIGGWQYDDVVLAKVLG